MKKLKGKILPIRVYGDTTLRKVAKPVEKITEEIEQFIEDLTVTMYEKDGVGLAAPQVGRSLRIFVVDPFFYTEDNGKNPIVFINPKFIEFSGEDTKEEGCLSLPEIFGKVTRAEKVIIEGYDKELKKIRYEADELFARCLQHENDHLDGILFIDKVSKIKRVSVLKHLKKLEKTTDKNGVNIAFDED